MGSVTVRLRDQPKRQKEPKRQKVAHTQDYAEALRFVQRLGPDEVVAAAGANFIFLGER